MSITYNITYVTAIIDLGEERPRSYENYIECLNKLSESGIPLVIYASQKYIPKIEKRTNVCIVSFEFRDLDLYSTYTSGNVLLPKNRNIQKDTKNYLILMNSKVEFVQRAIDLDHFITSHFAWIDGGIVKLFKDPSTTLKKLSSLSISTSTCLIFPGCFGWNKGAKRDMEENDWDMIQWRFCGGFFVGDSESLLDFYEICQDFYNENKDRLTWEVNVWASLERNDQWTPYIYIANHNDSIITNFPQ